MDNTIFLLGIIVLLITLEIITLVEFIKMNEEWFTSNVKNINDFSKMLEDIVEDQNDALLKMNERWHDFMVDIIEQNTTYQNQQQRKG